MKIRHIPTRHALAALILLGAGTGALFALHALRPAQAAGDNAAKPALTVTVTHPEVTSIASSFSANGNIVAWQEALIGAEVGGLRIAEVRVNVGDSVKKDDVLATFATETVAADLAVQKAQEAEAAAALADARANASRVRTLKDSGALSAQQINQYLTAEQTAQARLEAARALVKVQELRLRNTQVRAPDDGVISMREATIGAVVPSGTELFRMVRRNRLEWRAEVTSEELRLIRVGMRALVMPASFGPDTPPLKGTVRMIGPTVDAQARTAVVFVDLSSGMTDEPPVRAGMFATGRFNLGDTRGVTLPQESVVMRDGFAYVFKVGADHRVNQIKVTLGRRIDRRVEVLSDVSPEDEIAESGAGFLANGDLVAVRDSTPATTPAAK